MSVKELRSQAEIDRFIKDNKQAVIFYGTVSCGHCRNADPVYKILASKFPNVSFGHVEVSQVKINEPLQGFPAFKFYSSGQNLELLYGAPRLEDRVNNYFGSNNAPRRLLNNEPVKAAPRSPRLLNSETVKANAIAVRSPRNKAVRSPRKVRVVKNDVPRSPVPRSPVPRSPVQNGRANVRFNPRV